ncbi:MAG: hypothetical protein IAE91_01455 [Ignavibacteriaceae bacterium]|nr:hypothetical protein [Ignavibacteriaceae bacterium]
MEIIVIVGIIIVVIVVLVLISGGGGSKNSTWKSTAKTSLYSAENKMKSNNYYEVKDSLVELDKLLDFILKSKMIRGETLGERLKNAKNIFSKSDYNLLWEAHKLRNQLVHEVGQNVNVNLIRKNAQNMASILRKSI